MNLAVFYPTFNGLYTYFPYFPDKIKRKKSGIGRKHRLFFREYPYAGSFPREEAAAVFAKSGIGHGEGCGGF
jgi:hypothetical protein